VLVQYIFFIIMSDYPAVKLLILTLVGLFFGQFLDLSLSSMFIASLIAIIFSLLLIIIKKKGISLIISGLAIGQILSLNINSQKIDFPNIVLQSFEANISGVVEKIIREDSKKIRCQIKGKCDAKDLSEITDTRIILTIFKDDENTVKFGDIIHCRAYCNIPKPKQLPNDFDEQEYASSNAITFFAKTSWNNVAIEKPRSGFDRFISSVRTSVITKILDLFSKENRGVALALVTGDKSHLNYETKKNFVDTGTAHVLALSGLHVGIISMGIAVMLGWVYNRKFKLLIFVVVISGFIIFTGAQPSTLRAGLMASLFLLSLTFERRPKPLNIIALAALLIIVFDPMMIYSAGLQMSVASICGIIILFPLIQKTLYRLFPKRSNLLEYLINSIAVSVAASAIVSPLVAYYFGHYSMIGFFANIIIIPLMSLGMVFSMLSLLFSYLSFDLALLFTNSAEYFFFMANSINGFFAQFSIGILKSNMAFIVSIFTLLFVLYLSSSKSNRQLISRAIISISAFILIIFFNFEQEENGIKIFPREQFVAAEIPLSPSNTFFYLTERMPRQYPVRDYQFEQYMLTKDSFVLGITGNSTINLADNINKQKDVEIRSLTNEMQEKIEAEMLHEVKLYKANNINE
jgi:competence protein ComEC